MGGTGLRCKARVVAVALARPRRTGPGRLAPRLARLLFLRVLTHVFSLCAEREGQLTRFDSPEGCRAALAPCLARLLSYQFCFARSPLKEGGAIATFCHTRGVAQTSHGTS